MATKILATLGSLTPSQVNAEFGSGFTPQAGLTWTAVEIRPYLQGPGDCFVYVDDQQYCQIPFEDINVYAKPHVIAIQIQQPVVLHIKFTDRTGSSQNVGATLIVEESATTPGA